MKYNSDELSVSSIAPISSVATAAIPRVPPTAADLTLAVLQAQMVAFSQSAAGNGPSSIDYQALQAAIKSGNIEAAQAALARLHQDTKVIGSSKTADTSASSSPVDNDGDHDGGGATVESPTESSIDTRA